MDLLTLYSLFYVVIFLSLISSDKENIHSDEEKVKNEVQNDRETEGEIEEKDKVEKTEKEDMLDENGNEEQVKLGIKENDLSRYKRH